MVMSYIKSRAHQASYYLQGEDEQGEATLHAPEWFVTHAHGQCMPAWGMRDGTRWRSPQDKSAFVHMARGWHPSGTHPLARNHAQPARVAIHDFTLSAPKSVSVAWGLADGLTAACIVQAHDMAARAAMNTLARAAVGRLGKGGAIRMAAELCGAMFTHGTSRAMDPQLHTHCTTLNLVHRGDGRSLALEVKEMLHLQGLAGTRYALELAAHMRTLGFQIEHTYGGRLFELQDVPARVRSAFSKRRQHVLDAAHMFNPHAEHRPTEYRTRAAQLRIAAVTSRPRKRHEPAHALRACWSSEAHELGLDWVDLYARVEARRASVEVIDHERLMDLAQLHLLAFMRGRGWISPIQLELEVTTALMGLCDARVASEVFSQTTTTLFDWQDQCGRSLDESGWVLKPAFMGMGASQVLDMPLCGEGQERLHRSMPSSAA